MRDETKKKKVILLSVVLIVFAGFLVYFNSFGNGFIWDDKVLVTDNTYIRSLSTIHKIFTQDVGAGGAGSPGFILVEW